MIASDSTRRCRICDQDLPRRVVYFRFAIEIEGELDVLDTGVPGADDPRAILAELANVPAERAEAEVHWEAAGVLCGRCRRELVAWLGGEALQH